MSNFRDVFVAVNEECRAQNNETQQYMLTKCCATTEAERPRLWHVLEHCVAHRYELISGNILPEVIDWNGIKDWLIANWPKIVSMLISVIMLFLMF